MNENHLTFTSKGDMQAMRQQKATSHELGSIVINLLSSVPMEETNQITLKSVRTTLYKDRIRN